MTSRIVTKWAAPNHPDVEDSRWKDTNYSVLYAEGKLVILGSGPGKEDIIQVLNNLQEEGLTPTQVLDRLYEEHNKWLEQQLEEDY